MMRCYQQSIDKPTQELTDAILAKLVMQGQTNLLIDQYREMKLKLQAAKEQLQQEQFVAEVLQQQDYKEWLSKALKADERRRHKKVPEDDLKRVTQFIASRKASLPAVIMSATFTESTDRWGRKAMWRVQGHGHLTGLCVLDLDHLP